MNQGNVIPFNHIGSGKLSRLGLELPDDLSLRDWSTIGDMLSQADQSVMWWIGDWWVYGERKYGERSRLLDELRAKGHNPPAFKTCKNAGAIARQFTRARRRALAFDHHKAVGGLDENEQDWMLGRAEINGWTRAQLRDEVRRYKLERVRRPGEQKYKTQALDDLQELIDKGIRFGTILADPPWPYDNQGTRAATKNHYKEHNKLSIDDIRKMPIEALAADVSHLHLWTTNGFLRQAFDVIESWGFTYKSCFVWVKPDMGIGNYWRVGTEYMLLGTRGKAPFNNNSQQNWLYEKAGEHSAKPENVRRIIEQCSPGPYLELFARREVANWTVWGNEIQKSVDSMPLFG